MAKPPNRVGVNQSGSAALLNVPDGFTDSLVALQEIRAVTLAHKQTREVIHQAGHASSRRLVFHRNGNGPAVILYDVE